MDLISLRISKAEQEDTADPEVKCAIKRENCIYTIALNKKNAKRKFNNIIKAALKE